MDGIDQVPGRGQREAPVSNASRLSKWRCHALLADQVLRVPGGLEPADGFAIRVHPAVSIERTVQRVAPLLAAGKKVTLDFATPSPVAPVHGVAPENMYAILAAVSRALTIRGLGLDNAAIAVPADHPGTTVLAARSRGSAPGPHLLTRISDDFLRAVQFDRQLLHDRPGNRPAATPRQIWWSLLEQIEQGAGPVLFIEHDGGGRPALDNRYAASAASVSWPLLVKAPDYGAQMVLEMDLARLGMPQLWRPGCLSHDLVRVVDRLLETTQWPSASLALCAQQNRQVVLWLRGLVPLSRRLSRCPGAGCARLREIIAALRRSLMIASRRYFVEKAGQRRAPGWVSDINSADLRQQVASTLDSSGARPNFALAVSPWDLLPFEPGLQIAAETSLFPVLGSADMLIWQIPEHFSARKERLDRLFRMAWAAKNRC